MVKKKFNFEKYKLSYEILKNGRKFFLWKYISETMYDPIHNKLWYSFNIKVQLKHTIYIDNDSIFHLLNSILETFACWLADKNIDLSKYGLYQQAI